MIFLEKIPCLKPDLRLKKELLNLSIRKRIPLLGVCRGMQVINMYFGGNMKKIKGHMNTRHPVSIKKNYLENQELL